MNPAPQGHEVAAQGGEPVTLPLVGADREVWTRNQVLAAMRMAIAIYKERHVRADSDAFEHGLRGIADGACMEIFNILGFNPHKLVNLGTYQEVKESEQRRISKLHLARLKARQDEAQYIRSPEEAEARIAELQREIKDEETLVFGHDIAELGFNPKRT